MRKLLLAVLAIVLIAGCVAPTGAGTLQLKVTDQAQNITALTITIDKITAHFSTQNVTPTEEGTETNETEGTGWVTILRGPKMVDLVDVKDLYDILGETELPAGQYTQVRVYVSSATVTTDAGTFNLTIPSDAIKFVRPFMIEPNKTTSLIMDWDADKSVVFAGPNIILKPTVKLLTEFTGKTKAEADAIKEQQRADAQYIRESRRVGQKSTRPKPGPSRTAQVDIRNYAFIPNEITIAVGDTVVWTNKDNAQHTVTSDIGLFDSGLLSKDVSWNYTFTEAGNYTYHCTPHMYMTGKVIVI
ncbi:MAG: DUF4382 domain-containing protein [Candidatus Aenigmatarchaeota archaeon]